MKSIQQVKQEYETALAEAIAAESAKRKQQYIATRSHFPNYTAQNVLNLIRVKDPRVKDYKKCSPYNPRFTPTGYRALHCRWIENTAGAGLRFVDYADKIANLNHNGWYSDAWCEFELYRGAVWQLPARNGCAQYVYGYEDPNNDGAALIEFDVIEGTRGYDQGGWCDRDDMLVSAARDADSFAERMAESEREYQLKDQAEQRAEELKEEAATLREDLCGDIRTQRAKIAELLEKARDLIDNPHQLLY